MVFLKSNRLLFRSHESGDKSSFIEMQTNPDVRRYVGGKPWPREKAEYRFENQFLGEPSKTYGLWASILREENAYIGYCGLNRKYGPQGRIIKREANLAYYISKPYWGNGYATEASIAFVEHAFDRLNLEAIHADVEKGNDASEHILERLGFSFVDKKEIPNRIFHFYRLSRNEHDRLLRA